jgi:catechol 2,3-dioxygenase-like lactoylglutathione lyase family enzyme
MDTGSDLVAGLELRAEMREKRLVSVDSESSKSCRNTGIHHVGLYARDPSVSADFYRDLLGMQIVGGSGPEHPLGASAFLSSRPDEESHEIALFANPVLAHVAFKVSSLAELRSLHARVVEKGIPIKFAFTHGISFAFYFDDPDGHRIEVYWPTGAVAAILSAAVPGARGSDTARRPAAGEGGLPTRIAATGCKR